MNTPGSCTCLQTSTQEGTTTAGRLVLMSVHTCIHIGTPIIFNYDVCVLIWYVGCECLIKEQHTNKDAVTVVSEIIIILIHWVGSSVFICLCRTQNNNYRLWFPRVSLSGCCFVSTEIFCTDAVRGVMFGKTSSWCGSTVRFNAVEMSHVSSYSLYILPRNSNPEGMLHQLVENSCLVLYLQPHLRLNALIHSQVSSTPYWTVNMSSGVGRGEPSG